MLLASSLSSQIQMGVLLTPGALSGVFGGDDQAQIKARAAATQL
jgi:hypothetical protein